MHLLKFVPSFFRASYNVTLHNLLLTRHVTVIVYSGHVTFLHCLTYCIQTSYSLCLINCIQTCYSLCLTHCIQTSDMIKAATSRPRVAETFSDSGKFLGKIPHFVCGNSYPQVSQGVEDHKKYFEILSFDIYV